MRVKTEEFKESIRRRLADRAGTLCSKPDCGCHTKGPSDEGSTAVVNIGKAAHICAASEGGPRFDGTMSSEERSSIENAIWLCGSCHDRVDADVARYPAHLLRKWKRDHEAMMADTLGGRRAVLDRRNLEALARAFNLSVNALEANVKMSSTPVAQPLPQGLEFAANAMYSMDKEAVIVVGEVGNGSAKRITIRDVILSVAGGIDMRPEEVLVPDAFYVEGHNWLGTAPFAIEAGAFAKVAWYFNAAGTTVRALLEVAQPIACKLTVQCFPAAILAQELDLFSIARLKELSAR